MKRLSTLFMMTLAVLVLALHLPAIYERLAVNWVEKTHLFYSPTLKDFIYTETTAGYDPEAASKAEDHHANIAYKDAQGRYYHRLEFEKNLPFVYVRNMDRRGLLPMTIDGVTLDRKIIDAHRQVLELSVKNLPGHTPSRAFWPLLNTDPGQAGLVFPDDRFRFTDDAMEFINADYNIVDDRLTATWTGALVDNGFVFPARFVAGNFTILKPFDDGVFVVDSDYAVFHLKRVADEVLVTRTPIDPELETRYITVVESTLGQFHGLLLDGAGGLHLLTTDNYRLIELPLPGYDYKRMDFKILFDPLFRTAVYSNESRIYATVFDRSYQPLASHEHRMSRATPTLAQKIGWFLFPYRLSFTSETSRMISPRVAASPGHFISALVVGIVSVAVFLCLFRVRYRRFPGKIGLLFVFLTGVFGLVSGLIILDE